MIIEIENEKECCVLNQLLEHAAKLSDFTLFSALAIEMDPLLVKDMLRKLVAAGCLAEHPSIEYGYMITEKGRLYLRKDYLSKLYVEQVRNREREMLEFEKLRLDVGRLKHWKLISIITFVISVISIIVAFLV